MMCIWWHLKFIHVPKPTFYSLDMRRDVQEIFRMTPHEKQVMMFSATLSKEIRPVCKKFMQDVIIASCAASAESGQRTGFIWGGRNTSALVARDHWLRQSCLVY